MVSLGWHWLFWADGATCFAAAIILRFYLKENRQPTKKAQTVTADAQNISPSRLTRDRSVKEPKNDLNAQKSAYKDRDFLRFALFTFIGATVFMQFVWTVPLFFKEVYGWSEAKIGFVSAINAATVMLVEMPLIFKIENKRPKMWFVRFGIILYGVSYLAFMLPTAWGLGLAIFFMVAISFGEIRCQE